MHLVAEVVSLFLGGDRGFLKAKVKTYFMAPISLRRHIFSLSVIVWELRSTYTSNSKNMYIKNKNENKVEGVATLRHQDELSTQR
jgi:hypothetical protein